MKLLWTGTDSLMLIDYSMRRPIKRIYWWFFRRFIRIAEIFIQSHACISDNIEENLRMFKVRKPIEHIDTNLKHPVKYTRMPHDQFTILYYIPSGGDAGFNEWLYGYDIFLSVKEEVKDVKYIVVNGSNNMKYVYPFVDFYLRPNRHDGPSRIRMECDINGIPYYWTQKDPSAKDAIEAINEAKKNSKI